MTMPFGLWFGETHLGYGTHMAALAAAVVRARPGPVLEYGLGFYSTPLLHLLCEEMGRELLSIEGDPAWAERFASFRTGWHRVIGVEDWLTAEPLTDGVPWAVAFVDHGSVARRAVDIDRLAAQAEYIVVHDWEPGVERLIKHEFEYRWVSKAGPHTAVLSDVRPFSMVLT